MWGSVGGGTVEAMALFVFMISGKIILVIRDSDLSVQISKPEEKGHFKMPYSDEKHNTQNVLQKALCVILYLVISDSLQFS